LRSAEVWNQYAESTAGLQEYQEILHELFIVELQAALRRLLEEVAQG
jgi:hypothetical protein